MNPGERKTNLLVFLSLLMVGSVAHAQPTAPDIREVKPHVFLMLDASGSMSRKADCVCTTPNCTECLPICGVGAGTDERNRWAYVLEALTGEWTDPYTCTQEARSGIGATSNEDYGFQYDQGYILNHVLLPHEPPATVLPPQDPGILDTYVSRAKFGVMVSDNTSGLVSGDIVREKSYLDNGVPYSLSIGSTWGDWSYSDPSGSSPFVGTRSNAYNFDGGNPMIIYGVDLGIKGSNAQEGRLVSVGADADYAATNAAVQTSLLGDPSEPNDALNPSAGVVNAVRPYGEGPHGAMFTDLEYYLQTTDEVLKKTLVSDSKDIFYECRERVGILITDDISKGEYRHPDDLRDCTTGASSYCPYETPEVVVQRMMDAEDLTKLYVIGFAPDGDVAETALIEAYLNDLASIGDTDEAFIIEKTSVDFLGDLKTALSTILDQAQPGSTSRTSPVTTGVTPNFNQARILSGFDTTTVATDPWTGILEKRRIECVDGLPEEQEITDADRFQLVLNSQSLPGDVTAYSSGTGVNGAYTRNLWTVDSGGNRHIAGGGETILSGLTLPYPADGADPEVNEPDVDDVVPISFNKADIAKELLGVGTDAERDTIVEWVHGFAGTARENSKLGAIIHSTPVVVGPIISDLTDETFNQFRIGTTTTADPDGFQDPADGGGAIDLTQRPRVVYAASNDGIIHGFLVDGYGTSSTSTPATPNPSGTAFSCVDDVAAGTELWGFIPPDLLNNLQDLVTGFNWMTDGNLVVKNIYDVRVPDSTASASTHAWRTVLLMGFRAGGNKYIALDVTNPCEPEFLWQFYDDRREPGLAFGEPTIAQIAFNDSTLFNNNKLHTRSVAIIPGGQGTIDGSCSNNTYPLPVADPAIASDTTPTSSNRPTRRCWDLEGRVLYFVDMLTGSRIHRIDHTVFPAPLIGGVSVFRGGTGATASRAFVTDADGVIWRIDFSDLEPSNWTAIAFHDMFYDNAALPAEPAYNAPVITTDPAGNVVILQASGNIDSLDDPLVRNRVVSLTEHQTFNPDGSISNVEGKINWEIGVDGSDSDMLQPGEQITGPLELFAGNVFFGTYLASSSATNSCPSSGSRLWGVSYLDDAQINGGTAGALVGQLTGDAVNLGKDDLAQLDNTLLMGVRVEQEQPCLTTTSGTPFYDQYTQTYRDPAITTAASAPVFKLMGQISGVSTKIEGASLDNLSQSVASPYAKISGYVGTVN